MKCDRGAIRTGDFFRNSINDITIAEAMAVVNGLVAGLKIGLVQKHDILLIQTDNNGVMSVLDGTAVRKITPAVRRRRKVSWKVLRREARYHNAEIQLVASTFKELSERYALTIRWRHVKGHSGTKDKRSAVNSFCDDIARNHMRAARKKRIFPRAHAPVNAAANADIPCDKRKAS